MKSILDKIKAKYVESPKTFITAVASSLIILAVIVHYVRKSKK